MTYDNWCLAHAAGVSVIRNGTCAEGAQCPEGVEAVECEFNPCAATTCLAGSRATVSHCGQCTCECGPAGNDTMCIEIYKPVCGSGEAWLPPPAAVVQLV
jgi:hypothetical protein